MNRPKGSENFIDDRHALYVGWIAGLAMNNGVDVHPVLDGDGNYTDRLSVDLGGDERITLVVPPPPDDWHIGD